MGIFDSLKVLDVSRQFSMKEDFTKALALDFTTSGSET